MDETQSSCPCKRTKCERHGDCEACRAHHHGSQKKPLTTCERLKAKEETEKSRKTKRAEH